MAATLVGGGGGAGIKGGPRQTGSTIALVLCTWAVAEPLYVRVARTPEPERVFRNPGACQHCGGICPRADDQGRGLFQDFRLFACEIFRR
jgi:hypothetical protein